MRAGKINLAFGFAATKPGEYHAFVVTHQPSGSRAKVISVNRFANYSPSVDLEIESSILRGLVPLAPVVPPLGPANDSTGTVAPVATASEAPLAPYLEA
jgi:hypothetical protein